MKTSRSFALNLIAASVILAFPVTQAQAAAIHDASLFATTLVGNDDGSVGPVNTGFNLNFFGNNWNSLYVNNNGNVTFTQSLGSFTPWGISGSSLAMLAPFFADVDTRGASADVTYGANTLGGRNVFGVNWIGVGYYNYGSNLLNSFQLIITDRSDIVAGDFDFEFNYDTINWETGSASGGSGGLGGTSASAGWTNGSGAYYAFPGSLVNGALLDTGSNALVKGSRLSNTAGQYIFQVRSGQVINDVPEPASLALLGLGLAGLASVRRRKIH